MKNFQGDCSQFSFTFNGGFFLTNALQLCVIHIKGKPCAIYCRPTSMHPGFFGAFRTHQDFERKNFRGMHASRTLKTGRVTGGLCEPGVATFADPKSRKLWKKGSVFSNGSFRSIHPKIQRSSKDI